ncbi:hypothetical protein L1049_027340 [Liquidambar formosana]|uniref:Uncharacterized protein n=1 Tax=Liquidambar formosana TaxID=63359 RepID=A0AAP0N453_LIQFO
MLRGFGVWKAWSIGYLQKIEEVFVEKVPGLDGLKAVKIAAGANGVVHSMGWGNMVSLAWRIPVIKLAQVARVVIN